MTNQINLCGFTWETGVAIIGALAWIPWIFDRIKPSKLYGTIISNLENQGTFNEKKGTMHFLKLSISCMNKNFIVDNISIQVKYLNNDEWYIGNIFWARFSTWALNSKGTVIKKLMIPNNEFLGFVNMFEKDKSNFYYLTFWVDKSKLEEFEIIKISFSNPKKVIQYIEIKKDEFYQDRILFDDNIWR